MESSKCVQIISGVSALKQIREALGLTQAEFAKAIGTHQVCVARWERGKTKTSLTLRQVKALQQELAKLGLDFGDLPDE